MWTDRKTDRRTGHLKKYSFCNSAYKSRKKNLKKNNNKVYVIFKHKTSFVCLEGRGVLDELSQKKKDNIKKVNHSTDTSINSALYYRPNGIVCFVIRQYQLLSKKPQKLAAQKARWAKEKGCWLGRGHLCPCRESNCSFKVVQVNTVTDLLISRFPIV